MHNHAIRPIPLTKVSNWIPSYFTYMVSTEQPQTQGIYVWFIDGPKERILVDAGATADGLPSEAGKFRFPGAIYKHVQTIEEGLGKFGLKPEDIEIVILTQLHSDHIQLAHKYTKAKFIIQKAELDFALNPHPMMAWGSRFPFKDLNFEVIEGDKEIIDGVSVVLTPGHSAGTQSVMVETAQGRAVIVGPCSVRRNFEPPPALKTPVIAPGIHLDLTRAYESMLKIKEIADIIIPTHDPEFLERDRIP